MNTLVEAMPALHQATIANKSWVEVAHDYGIDLLFGVVMLVVCIWIIRRLMGKLDSTLEHINAGVSEVISKAKDIPVVAGDAARAAEDADESLRLLNERTVLFNSILKNLEALSRQHESIVKCLDSCSKTINRLDVKSVEDLPITLKLISEQQKEVVKRIDSVIQVIINKIEKG